MQESLIVALAVVPILELLIHGLGLWTQLVRHRWQREHDAKGLLPLIFVQQIIGDLNGFLGQVTVQDARHKALHQTVSTQIVQVLAEHAGLDVAVDRHSQVLSIDRPTTNSIHLVG